MKGNIGAFNAKYGEVRSVFEGMYGDKLSDGIVDVVCRVVARYYDRLSDYDIREVLNQIYDSLDSSLGLGEVAKIVEDIVKRYVESFDKYMEISELDKLMMERDQLDDVIVEIEDRLEYCSDPGEREFLLKELERVKREKMRIEARIRRLEARRVRRVRTKKRVRVKPLVRTSRVSGPKTVKKVVVVARAKPVVRTSSCPKVAAKPVRDWAVASKVVSENDAKPSIDFWGIVGRVGVIGFLVGLEFLFFNYCNNVFGVFALTWTAVLKFTILYNYIEK
jgi:hypothetical protein